MEFEKLQKIIAEVMNVSEEEIRPETTFVDDLERILLMYSRLSWESRKNLILRSTTRKLRRSRPYRMRQIRSEKL